MKLKPILIISGLIALKSIQLACAEGTIVGGATVDSSDPIAHSTVALLMSGNPHTGNVALCTGSLISSDLIVTAAHCLEGHPAHVQIVFAPQITQDSLKTAVNADRFLIHPDYRMNQTAPDQNDIALIQFKGGLPEGYQPNRLLVDLRLLTRGENVVLAGYGIDDAETHAGAGTLRQTDVSIADENFGKTEVLLTQTGGKGACHGDSGGPAFLREEGNLYLWGVTSRAYPNQAPDDCAHESVYTKILDQTDFLKFAIQQLRHPS